MPHERRPIAGILYPNATYRSQQHEANIPLDAVRRPRDTPIWKIEATLKCWPCRTPHFRRASI
jgi:hypothetical protein